jgi:hypothetical protein
MNLRPLGCLILCLPLAGCMSSVRVHRSTSLASPPEGIPFYAKTAVCKQETVWLEPQYFLVFAIKSSDQSNSSTQKVLSREDYLSSTVQDFLLQPDRKVWEETILKLKNPEQFNEGPDKDESVKTKIKDLESRGNWIRASNTGTVEVIVDYTNVFYLNSARPLAGQTQVSAKLAPDGTLTEGSAQLTDQTLSTIASTISSLVGSAASTMKIMGIEAPAELKISVSTKIYKHSHVKYEKQTTPATPSSCPAVADGVYGPLYNVVEVTDASTGKPAGSEKEKDNTISVSGSIVLPKQTASPSGTPTAPAAKGQTTP